MSYVILVKDNMSTKEITNKEEAQKLMNEGYEVKIDKAGWGLKKETKKKAVKKSKKSKK